MVNASEQVGVSTVQLKRARAREYFELTKPRLNSLVLLTTFVGFFLASSSPFDFALLFHTLVATAMVAGGGSALNQLWERENDALMVRTRHRPLPSGRVEPREALFFGIGMGLIGTLYLWMAVNPLTSVLGFLSYVVYVFAYTPMKTRSPWNTFVGAISGALPPMMGWTAVRNNLGIEAWVLFGILFLWQHPHFFSLAWRLRADYAQGGFRMLPVRDPHGRLSGILMSGFSLALVPVSAALTLTGVTGNLYLVGSLLLGVAYIWYSVAFLRHRTDKMAMKVFFMSLVYLTVLVVLMMVDKGA